MPDCSRTSLRTNSKSASLIFMSSSRRLRLELGGVGEPPVAQPADDLAGDLLERHHLIGEPSLGHRARHAPDHRTRLILGDDLTPGGADALAALQAIVAHAGHDYRQDVLPAGFRERAEQYIDRRSAGILVRLLVDAQTQSHRLTLDQQMEIAWG